jgi:hypothetical protein
MEGNNIRCDSCSQIYQQGAWHTCNGARASLSFHYPFRVNDTIAIGTSTRIVEGRKTSSGGGFATTEKELRRDFEHFILDLKLLGALK